MRSKILAITILLALSTIGRNGQIKSQTKDYAMNTIENIQWTFKGENMDLFNGTDTPLNKDFEFYDYNKPKTDSVTFIGEGSHGIPHGLKWFKLEFRPDHKCRLTWSETVGHVVIGTTTASFSMIGKWELKDNDLLIYYEYPVYRPILLSTGESRKEYIPSKYTHVCRIKKRMEDNNLILTSIEVETLKEDSKIIVTTAKDLIAEFTKNTEYAIEKYNGKTVQITGELFEKGSPKDNIPETNASYIIFGDWKDGQVYILCYFDKVVVLNLTIGETITVTGNFTKFQNLKDIMKSVILEKGIIKKTASETQ